MDLNKIIEKLNEGVVLLEYTSLVSGDNKIREMTLNENFIPEKSRIFRSNMKWNADNQKLICYDIEFAKWDDIDRDTIKSYKVVQQDKDFKKKQRELTDLNYDGE